MAEKTSGLYVVFDSPPGPEGCQFVEVEDETGAGVRLSEGNGWHVYGDPSGTSDAGYYTLGPFREAVPAWDGEGEEPEALQVARGLEELAAWLREHPDFPVWYASAAAPPVYRHEGDEGRARFVDFIETLGVPVGRGGTNDLIAEREFSGGVTLTARADESLWDEPTPDGEKPLPAELQRFAAVCHGPLNDDDEGQSATRAGCRARSEAAAESAVQA
jgi:hypothetical protein